MMGENMFINSLSPNTIPLVSIGVVVGDGKDDKFKAGLIQVRLLRDGQIVNKDLLECAPLLPRFLNVLPKAGESVFIFTQSYTPQSEKAVLNVQRYWLGPLISQDIFLENQAHLQATAVNADGTLPLYPPNDEPGAYGNPTEGDVTLQGRNNTDIIQKNREIWIRAGKFESSNNKLFNSVDMGYIQLKYGSSIIQRKVIPKEVKTYKYENPEILVNVQINTYSGSTQFTLPGNLPNQSYNLPTMLTNLVLSVNRNLDVIEGSEVASQIYSFNSASSVGGPGDYNNREAAIAKAIELIDLYKGEKWKIKSNANEILDYYGRDANNKITDFVLFKSEPTIVTRTINEIKFISTTKNNSSVLNMVANKINLVSYDGAHSFNLTDPEKLIDEKTQIQINSKAHPLVYGDKLVEFLELVRSYVEYHVHPYDGIPADPGEVKKDVLNYDLNTILNHNINSN